MIERLLVEARNLGYEEIKLDTLPGKMDGARRLYERYGFEVVEGYYDTPLEGTIFLGRKL